jgi:cell division transport system ATP-binding protein
MTAAVSDPGGCACQTARQRAQRTWRPLGSRLAGFTSYDVAQDGQTISIGESGARGRSATLAPDPLTDWKPSRSGHRPVCHGAKFAGKAESGRRLAAGIGAAPAFGFRRDWVIVFENVGLRYGLGPEVLRDLTFRIDGRSFQFLTGPSGAGKTSLLRLLFLSLRPTRGLVTMFDQDTATLSKDSRATLRRRIGIVFQDFRLLDHMTTYENVALPLRVLGKQEADYRAEVVELLQWVGLGDRLDALPPILSGGEKQRAAIARAVIARPQLLLADEPTGNVDPNLGQRLLRLFIELNKSGTSIVIATHDIALMDEYDARRLVLHEGRLHVYE